MMLKRLLTFGLLSICCSTMMACALTKNNKSNKNDKKDTAKKNTEVVSDITQARLYYFDAIKLRAINNNVKDAEQSLLKSIALNPDADAPYYELAATYAYDSKKALPYVEKAVSLDSTNLWYQYMLGSLYARDKQYEKALKTYNKISLKDSNPEVYKYIAALNEQTGMTYEALATIDSAEMKFGANEELGALKTRLLMGIGLIDKATSQAEAMASMYPDEITHVITLAEIYASLGKDSLALANYNKAATINNKSNLLLLSMNNYYRNKNDNKNFLLTTHKLFDSNELDAQSKVDFFVETIKNPELYTKNYFGVDDVASLLYKKYPEDSAVLKMYTDHLINSGRVEESLPIFKKQLADNKYNLDAIQNIIGIETYLQRPDSATHYMQEALQTFPENIELRLQWAYQLGSKGETALGLKEAEKALKYATTDSLKSVVYGSIGDIKHEMGKNAYKDYDKALKYDPDNVLVLNNYSFYLANEESKMDKALKMAERMVSIGIENPTYLDTYGWVLYKAGRLKEAKEVIRKAISLDDQNSPELLLHYGDVLFDLGDKYMASIYWEKALKAGYKDKDAVEKRLAKIHN